MRGAAHKYSPINQNISAIPGMLYRGLRHSGDLGVFVSGGVVALLKKGTNQTYGSARGFPRSNESAWQAVQPFRQDQTRMPTRAPSYLTCTFTICEGGR